MTVGIYDPVQSSWELQAQVGMLVIFQPNSTNRLDFWKSNKTHKAAALLGK